MKKRNVMIILGIVAFIIIVGGISYSYFVYNKDIGNVSLTAGEISINLSNVSNDQTLTNVIPKSDNEGKASPDYLDFTVDGTVDSEKIYYEVYIMPDSNNTIDTDYIKTYLTDQEDNEIKGVTIYNSLQNSEITGGKRLYRTVIELNNDYSKKTYSKDFRLRIWLDENYTGTTAKTFDFDINLYAKNVEEDYQIPEALSIIKSNVITPSNPINFANNSSVSNGQGLYILPGTENDTNPIYYYRGDIDNNNVIFGGYCWHIVRTTDTGGIKMIYNGTATGNGETCENSAHADRIISSSLFNTQDDTIADMGYANNQRYSHSNTSWTTGALFASSAIWNGTNYELIDASVTTPNSTHHYSCNATTPDATCTSLRYVYYSNGTTIYYITLTNGELIEDALYKMTGNGSVETKQKNSGYVLNQNDSTIKSTIETWFRTNLTNEVDNTKRNYVTYLEDTIFCNDRSYRTTGSYVYANSGWNPNGGILSNHLYFKSMDRVNNTWYNTTNVPILSCPNKTDSFSVSNSIAHLNYPVGLLTVDEIIMAGAAGTTTEANNTFYLYTGGNYWSLSPSFYNLFNARNYYVNSNGILKELLSSNGFGVRPVVSLKSDVEFETGGDGTPTNPYVVKYE